MASVHIPCTYLRGVESNRGLLLDCDMTEPQMFAALQNMLARITGETWAEWCARIDEEAEPTDAADSLAARETA